MDIIKDYEKHIKWIAIIVAILLLCVGCYYFYQYNEAIETELFSKKSCDITNPSKEDVFDMVLTTSENCLTFKPIK